MLSGIISIPIAELRRQFIGLHAVARFINLFVLIGKTTGNMLIITKTVNTSGRGGMGIIEISK